ncbi:Neutral endopeptidase O [Furfurilactobacillus rossiae]|uniref:M13-type metalloendopeptidase n=1 Tax=Furfurilactobacillus rossiae TaxID=231049 RepID=UPI0015BB93A8|nr:M13 family metallopeptidase [Furfurilactobacillus rossiae]MCF6164627.1 M13 family metallopeptidase [Furfurilactobacillus rossiae]QLE64914.1 Neutral endopeptidase O [Furfurilactobacillus rossiae]
MSLKHNLNAALVGGASSATEGTASVKDDLYLSVNGEWLKTAKIPADRSTAGGFTDLDIGVEKTLMHDFEAMVDGKVEPDNVLLANFVKYYQLANDLKHRDADGMKPIKPLLKEIESLSDFKDLQNDLFTLSKRNINIPCPMGTIPDMKDTKHYVLAVGAPDTFLPDVDYYKAENKDGKKLLSVLRQTMTSLFKLADFEDQRVESILDQAISFDKKIAQHSKTSEQKADVPSYYNPENFETFGTHSQILDLKKFVKTAIGNQSVKIIDIDPQYYNALDEIVTEDSFDEIKSWLLVSALYNWSGYLSDQSRVVGGTYKRALYGQEEAPTAEKAAFRKAYKRFSMVVGDYYGRKYFGSAAKADVLKMVHRMINVYKDRLSKNKWLGEETREKAILKLDSLVPNVGFPNQISPIYTKFVVQTAAEGGSFFSNELRFSEIENQHQFDLIGSNVDRSEWEDINPAEVNAFYTPMKNSIFFPAAILQAPFYSLKQTSSENYAGIGAVMAHEISHAFDNNGASFDEHGNLNNWWTEADLKRFKDLTQSMAQEFDGIEFVGKTVNGKLTVTENVADGGGLSCALEAAKQESDFSSKDFFENWAKIWREKSSTEFLHWVMATDVHAPSKLRANVQAQNIDDFYTTFDVHEGDGMWLAPEKRVHIW